MPLPRGWGEGAGVGVCAFAQITTTNNSNEIAVIRESLIVGDIDLDLSTGHIRTRRDAEDESGRRNSAREELRRQSEDRIKNIAVGLLALRTVVFRKFRTAENDCRTGQIRQR